MTWTPPVNWQDENLVTHTSPTATSAANFNLMQTGLRDLFANGLGQGGHLVAYGTSRSTGASGVAAAGPYDSADRFPSKLAGMLGLGEVMYAMAGARLSWDEQQPLGGGWSSILHRVRRQTIDANQNQLYVSPDQVVTICDWINDLADTNGGLGGATRQNARTTAIAQNTMRFLISLASASRLIPSNYAGNTLGGGATLLPVSYTSVRTRPYDGAISGPNGYVDMPSGSTVSFALPSDYPGSAVTPLTVLCSANPATATGTITVTGSGIPTKTLNLTTDNDPTYSSPLVARYSGSEIPAGARTITITANSITGGNPRYQGSWIEATTPPQILAYNTARTNGTFYFTHLTDADYFYWNTLLSGVVAEFGSNVRYVDVDAVLGGTRPTADTALTPYITDSMHHTAAGEAEKALLGFCELIGLDFPARGTSHPLRDRARRSRAQVQDFIFDGFAGSTVNVANNDMSTPVVIDAETLDNSGMHHDTTNKSRLICLSDGRYQATFRAQWANSTVGIRGWFIRITRANGSTEILPGQTLAAAGSSATALIEGGLTLDFHLYVGDYIEAIPFQNSGGTLALGNGRLPIFTLRKLADF
jgi:hypothetical protein